MEIIWPANGFSECLIASHLHSSDRVSRFTVAELRFTARSLPRCVQINQAMLRVVAVGEGTLCILWHRAMVTTVADHRWPWIMWLWVINAVVHQRP